MTKLTKLTSADYSKLLGLHHLNPFVLTRDVNALTRKMSLIHSDVHKHKNTTPPVMFIADFDSTLTKPAGLTSWSIIDSHPEQSEEFKLKCVHLALKHYPSEVSSTISVEEKDKQLDEWYHGFHRYICDMNYKQDEWCRLFQPLYQPSDIYTAEEQSHQKTPSSDVTGDIAAYYTTLQGEPVSTLKNTNCKVLALRDGYTAFAEKQYQSKIPQLIVSAGQGLPILHALYHELHHHKSTLHPIRAQGNTEKLDSLQICANWCEFDTQGKSVGYWPVKPIHVYSKHTVPEVSEMQTHQVHACHTARVHMVLAGDSLGDLTIEKSGHQNDQVLKIGILNIPGHLATEALTMQTYSKEEQVYDFHRIYADTISVQEHVLGPWHDQLDDRILLPPHDVDCPNVQGKPPSMGTLTCIHDLLQSLETGCQACLLDKWRAQLLKFTDQFDLVVIGDSTMRGLTHAMDAIQGTSNSVFQVSRDHTIQTQASSLIPTQRGFKKIIQHAK